ANRGDGISTNRPNAMQPRKWLTEPITPVTPKQSFRAYPHGSPGNSATPFHSTAQNYDDSQRAYRARRASFVYSVEPTCAGNYPYLSLAPLSPRPDPLNGIYHRCTKWPSRGKAVEKQSGMVKGLQSGDTPTRFGYGLLGPCPRTIGMGPSSVH